MSFWPEQRGAIQVLTSHCGQQDFCFPSTSARGNNYSPCKCIQIFALANMSKVNTSPNKLYSADPIHGTSNGCYIRLN